MTADYPPRPTPMRVCLLGATGTIGRATLRALLRRGHNMVCFVRPRPGSAPAIVGATVRIVEMCDPVTITRDGFRGERFDAVVSCMASRTGAPRDAWAVDYQAHAAVLAAAREVGVGHFVQLSAICVQKPLLAFQYAKLTFEAALIESGLTYSIVRPTAFFKSLCGQIERVKRGKPFVMFRDGTLTACKPISGRRSRRLSCRLPGGPSALEPRAADRRAGRGDHPAPAGRSAVRVAGPQAAFPPGADRVARRCHSRAERRGRPRAIACGQGGTGADRSLLRH